MPNRDRHLTVLDGGATVPAELIHAIKTTAPGRRQPVWIPLPRAPDILITVIGTPPHETDLPRLWRFLRIPHPGTGQLGPYRRADMPLPLAAYVLGGHIILSNRLRPGELAATARTTRRGWCSRYPGRMLHGAAPAIAAAASRLGGGLQVTANSHGPLGAAAAGIVAVLLTITAVITGPPATEPRLRMIVPPAVAPTTPGPDRPPGTAEKPAPGDHRPQPGGTCRHPRRCRHGRGMLGHPLAGTVGRHPVRAVVGQHPVRATVGEHPVASAIESARQAWSGYDIYRSDRPYARERIRDAFGGVESRNDWGPQP